MLEDVAWQFAHKVKPLSLLTLESVSYGHVYQYPSDCLKVNKLIVNGHTVVDYEVQVIDDTKVIVSDQPELYVDYRSKTKDPNLFTTQFRMTLAHLLASEIAVPIVGAEMGRQLRSDSFKIYNRYLNAAIASNSNERRVTIPESDFITIRA